MNHFNSAFDIVAVLGGIYYADFFTGLVHIYLDHKRIVPNSTSVLDDTAEGFQYHHKKPLFFTQNRAFYNPLGQFQILVYLTTPVHLTTALVDFMTTGGHWFFIGMYTYIMVATVSQIIHGYSHKSIQDTPFIILTLQNLNILLSKKQHHIHHANGTFNFAIVNGWSNPFLNILYKSILLPLIKSFPDHFHELERESLKD
jgi:hypothetical protein